MVDKTKAMALGLAGATSLAVVWRRLQQIDLHGKVVVITGGSRGLGLELAREFARAGSRLVLLAREAEELQRARAALGGMNMMTVACDVRHREAVSRAVADIVDATGSIDVLVNVAGVIDVAPFEHLEDVDFEDSLDTHLWGPLHLIREAVPHMKSGGRIVNISSIGGLVSVPHLIAYSVGKFALTGLSEGLQAELSLRGIRVSTVCPGLMRTGSHVNARFKGRRRLEFAWFASSAGFPLASMNSRRAARKIVAACRAGKPFLILTPQARALHLLHAIAPNGTAAAMRLVARVLPDRTGEKGNTRYKGWQSASRFAPSLLTRMADRAIARNNQLDDSAHAAYLRNRPFQPD